jgi:hypothetical protein
MHQHKAAAANIPCLWDGYRKRKANRHRGVHGIAAPLQNIQPDPGRLPILARNHAMPGGRHLGGRRAGALFDKVLMKSLLGWNSGRPSQP